MSVLSDKVVTVYRGEDARYAARAPFSPAQKYPEYAFADTASEANPAYEAVRSCFQIAGLDAAHFETADWNPLQDLIQPGETVLLKPNMVHQRHPRDPEGWRYVITHGSIIRAVADYVWKAVGQKGRIILADAPQTDAAFAEMVSILGLDVIRDFYSARGLTFEIIDLRQEEWTTRGDVVVARRKLSPNPYGSIPFDLGQASEFVEHRGAGHYYGADYDAGVVNRHHSGGRHEYLVAGCAIQCDVVFSLPKLKTHKKAGITASLKNLVGVNADKNWLPHHTEGAPQSGGDEHPSPDLKHRTERKLAAAVRGLSLRMPVVGPWVHRVARGVGKPVFGDTEQTVRSGNWFGNDTVWRMCLDLNKIVSYGNSDGSLRDAQPRNRKRHYLLVDGIMAGQGRGPLNPDPVATGVVLFGVHPPSVDAVCAYLMGFDPEKIPIVSRAFQCGALPLSDHRWRDVAVRSNSSAWNRRLTEISGENTFHFEPHFGWKGHIERSPAEEISLQQAVGVAEQL
ncbi:MAG: DUF362 domain-containing protein [Acidobacteriia bacterium]|nr:DUF362 domain-containing protein [Terriglobia bacterium]